MIRLAVHTSVLYDKQNPKGSVNMEKEILNSLMIRQLLRTAMILNRDLYSTEQSESTSW